IQPVGIAPKIFEIRPAAVWLGPKVGGALDATFESAERLPLVRGATWLQVAATASYDVIINDRLALSQARPQQTKLPFAESSPAPSPARFPSANIGAVTPQASPAASPTRFPSANIGAVTPQPSPTPARVPSAPVMSQHGVRTTIATATPQPFSSPPAAHGRAAQIGAVTAQRSAATAVVKPFKGVPPTSVPTLVAYDVSRFMRTGQNTVRIHVRSEFGVPAVLAEGHTEVPGGTTKTFSTNGEWHVREQMTGTGSTGKATVLGSYGMEPWGVLPQVAADPQLLAVWDLRTPLERLLTIVLIEISLIWVWLTAASWLQRKRQWSYEQALDVCALLHLPTFAALMLLC